MLKVVLFNLRIGLVGASPKSRFNFSALYFRVNGEIPMKQLEEWIPEDDSEAHDLDDVSSNLPVLR